MRQDKNIAGKEIQLTREVYDFPKGTKGIAIYEEAYNHGASMSLPDAENGGKPYQWFFSWEEIELVEDMSQEIEVGDIVTYKNPIGPSTRGHYPIKSINGNQVIFEDGDIGSLDKLKLVSKANKGEIVGYELLKDLPGIPAGTKSSQFYDNSDRMQDGGTTYLWFQGKNTGNGFDKSQLADTTWFKPIYKPKEVVVKISKGREVKIYSDNKVLHLGKEELPLKDFQALWKFLDSTHSYNGFNLTVESFKLGCQSFVKEDLVLIYRAIQNLK